MAEKAKDSEAIFDRLKGWYKDDIDKTRAWRKHAKEHFDFVAGNQWSDGDLAAMQEQKRPVLTFNNIAPLANAVVGSEMNNRRETRYIPREQGDAHANEILTAGGEWFRDEANAEYEDSEAFRDMIIGGLGFMDTRLDYEDDPDGAPLAERIDPFEMVFPSTARKLNMTDAMRMFRVREMTIEEAQDMFPDMPKEALHAGWARDDAGRDNPHQVNHGNRYADDNQGERTFEAGEKVVIVEARWLEREPYYRGLDPQNPQAMREYTTAEVKQINKEMPEIASSLKLVRQMRKVAKRAFLGNSLLAEIDSPLAPQGRLGWDVMTGYFDTKDGLFYGIVRAAIDPQRWTNKFFSQIMHLLNSQSKGGLLAEKEAFDNIRQADETWASPDAITWVNAGALQSGQIQPKPPAQFPQGFFALFNESKEAITQVTGLSREFIGTREVDQAGVLENTRKQSSLGVLASLFNALRLYRKRQAETILYLLQNYLSDGRLIRVVGMDQEQYLPLFRQADKKYDIIIDDSPTSPNEKERTWAVMQSLFPLVSNMITPEILPDLLELSPLPASLVAKLRERAKQAQEQQSQQPPQPSPEEMAAKVKTESAQADLAIKQQLGQMKLQEKAVDLMAAQRKAELEAMTAEQKARNDAQRLAIEESRNAIRRISEARRGSSF
ncbi:portal protein [Pseudochrobactrum kiredjianiae]|uniref:Phage portal protein n=1 Tax=Pseudochrobactrum kiredjianiae TaxID=386305 RepID=A0ABW3V1L4_9HYPH|nr:phage portal protein [Pseudochrobactrum kiredjianiae]MDM7852361.1 phage portal protein [Pseudochrobactrum kiredjianiae]